MPKSRSATPPHHDVNGGIEEVLGLFRIEVFNELGGVLDIGKQDRDLFAFAFKGAARMAYFVGEVSRRIGNRITFLIYGGRRCGV
jgi:hypothetical protein